MNDGRGHQDRPLPNESIAASRAPPAYAPTECATQGRSVVSDGVNCIRASFRDLWVRLTRRMKPGT